MERQRRKVCRFCESKANFIDYKDDRTTAPVHLRARQDCTSSGDRKLRQASERTDRRYQARQIPGYASVHFGIAR